MLLCVTDKSASVRLSQVRVSAKLGPGAAKHKVAATLVASVVVKKCNLLCGDSNVSKDPVDDSLERIKWGRNDGSGLTCSLCERQWYQEAHKYSRDKQNLINALKNLTNLQEWRAKRLRKIAKERAKKGDGSSSTRSAGVKKNLSQK